jgi:nucleoid-associated protein YgaU
MKSVLPTSKPYGRGLVSALPPTLKKGSRGDAVRGLQNALGARGYVVQTGDTLSGIAQQQLGSGDRWPEIFELNRALVHDPDRISPGQILTMVISE